MTASNESFEFMIAVFATERDSAELCLEK